MQPIRSFVAIELPDVARHDLSRLVSRLDSGVSGVRWIPANQMHLTLKFLGDIDERDLPMLCDLLSEAALECEPFHLSLRGAGCFPPSGPVRIVWAGLEEPTGRLARLHERCEALFAGLGFKQEHRAFRAHVTMARVKSARAGAEIRQRVAAHVDFAGATFDVDEIVFYQSLLERDGAKYVALSRHGLGQERES
ncbi:MAG: RNA 2',3'-cyclic phosphodiesterase [Phycisphaerae bacterium]|nr:RNA 2',3'-cyclic phosphodiesterase [Phycisphaerae bacterium]NUQ44519.1 RNA 2',3'-cyclic phosphodiesterase [Phycisphaerae bacterium]